MKVKHIVYGLLFTLSACTNKTPPPQENILYQVEGFFSQKPDSALQILDTLTLGGLSEKEYAHYCLLKVRVRDCFFLYDSITDSLLKVAENYYVDGNDKWFEAQTCEALSRITSKEGKGEQIKLEWLLKALQSIEQCRHIDERLVRFFAQPTTEQEMIDFQKYGLHFKLGMCYLNNHYNEESLNHLRKAGRYFENTEHTIMRIRSANILGNSYLANNLYDSCLLWYEKGLDVAENHGKIPEIAYSHFSMSTYFVCRFEDHDYGSEEEGRQLLRQSVAECHQGLALYEGSMSIYKDCFYNDLSNAYFQLGQYDSCLYYSEKLLAYHQEHYPNIVPDSWVVNLYRHMYQSHEALGHTQETLKYARLYFEMQQAIEKQPQAVEQVKNEYDKKLEMLQLQNKQQVKQFQLYLLLALVLLSLVVVLWLSNRYRKNKELEIMRQKDAYRKLESEFVLASQHSLQALQQRVMELYKTKGTDSLERVMGEFEASYPLAKEKIKTNYPNLTESERNIVILSFLGFRTKEEAEILHLSLNTVEKYRTNIRKKAGSDAISQLIG